MKNLLILTSLFLSSGVAMAGPSVTGGAGEIAALNCSSPNQGVQLNLVSSAATTYWTGRLSLGSNPTLEVQCTVSFGKNDVASWSCAEDRGGDGRFLVELSENKTGVVSGIVYHEQIFPLKPKAVSTLNCQ